MTRQSKQEYQIALRNRRRGTGEKSKGTMPTVLPIIPKRNGKCPNHPEFKYKKCPHRCIDVHRIFRESVGGVQRMIEVNHENLPENSVF